MIGAKTSPRLEIGRIVNTHGIHGEIKIQPWCDNMEIFETVGTLYTADGAKLTIDSVRYHKGNVMLKLHGFNNINQVECFKGSVIFAERENLPPLNEGEFYLQDMLGMDVVEDGEKLGIFHDFIEIAGRRLYIIKADTGEEFMLPAVPEFIRKIDIGSKVMTVIIPKGLLEDGNEV